MDKEIEAIERMPTSLSDRTDTLLVYAGEKPATVIGGLGTRYNPITKCRETDEKNLLCCIERINEAGLAYEIGNISMSGLFERRGKKYLPSNEHIPIFVAHDQKTARTIRNAGERGDEWKFGKLEDYPQTAIMAYMGEIPRLDKKSEKFDCTLPEHFFTQFVFSDEFFMDEYESTSVRWHDAVKRLSPTLYGGVLYHSEHQKNYMRVEHIVGPEEYYVMFCNTERNDIMF